MSVNPSPDRVSWFSPILACMYPYPTAVKNMTRHIILDVCVFEENEEMQMAIRFFGFCSSLRAWWAASMICY